MITDAQFDDLLRALLDGDESRSTLSQLASALEGNPERIRRYVALREMDALLTADLGLGKAGYSGEPDAESSTAGEGKIVAFPRLTWALALAACVALSAAITAFFLNRPNGNAAGSGQAVAVLIDGEDARWEGSAEPKFFGTQVLENEPMKIESGVVRLALRGGAGIAIEGPAEVKLVSSEEAQVTYGRVSAYAPEEAIGFKITTPEIEITDLGTRFATNVSQTGQTEVHVFEGEVAVKGRQNSGEDSREILTGGAARRFERGGQTRQAIAIDPALFVEPPALEQLLATSGEMKPVITIEDESGEGAHVYRPGVIASHVFSGFEGEIDGLGAGTGFGNSHWRGQRPFTHLIAVPGLLSEHPDYTGRSSFLLLRGRNSAEPFVVNRVGRRLAEPLPDEFFFSVRGQYRGLDEDDFFCMWLGDTDREDSSHSREPNMGILKGKFFGRLELERTVELDGAAPGERFLLVAHYARDPEPDGVEAVTLWVNPGASGANGMLPEPVGTVTRPLSEPGTHTFRYLGLRMGKYTEVTDELVIDHVTVAETFEAAVSPLAK